MLRSSGRTSTKTGGAPQCSITFAVAGQVIGVVITSSPGPTPRATQGEVHRRRAGGERDDVLGLEVRGHALLEQRGARAGRQPAGAQRLGDGLDLLLADAGGWKPSLEATPGAHRRQKRMAAAARRARPGRRRGRRRRRARRRRGRRRAAAARTASPATGRRAPSGPRDAPRPPRRPRPRAAIADRRDEEDDAGPAGRRRRASRVPDTRHVRRPSAKSIASPFRSTPSAASQSSASCPPPSRAASSITRGPSGPRRTCVYVGPSRHAERRARPRGRRSTAADSCRARTARHAQARRRTRAARR